MSIVEELVEKFENFDIDFVGGFVGMIFVVMVVVYAFGVVVYASGGLFCSRGCVVVGLCGNCWN